VAILNGIDIREERFIVDQEPIPHSQLRLDLSAQHALIRCFKADFKISLVQGLAVEYVYHGIDGVYLELLRGVEFKLHSYTVLNVMFRVFMI